MKSVLSLGALALFVLAVQAQTVTTSVVGGITLNLEPGSNFLGFALQPVLELQSEVSIHGTDRTRVFLPATFALAEGQYGSGAQATHVLEFIDSGEDEGFHSVITQTLAEGKELNLVKPVPAGLGGEARVRLWKLWTLADVFGATNNRGLAGGTTPVNADLILVPSGNEFLKFFYSTGGGQGTGWRLASGGVVDQGAVTLPFAGGLVIQALGARSLLLVGQVKTGKTQVTLQTGRNYLANLCPVNAGGATPSTAGLTLSSSGLQNFITPGKVSAQADLVLIWSGGTYTQFYYATGGLVGTGWRRVGGGPQDQGSVPLPDGAFAIQRRGGPVDVVLSQGNF